jgi:hypothetical protein
MLPARPVVCEPLAVIAPVIGWLPSVNKRQLRTAARQRGYGRGRRQRIDDVAAAVVEHLQDVPEGFENCRFVPSAALSCDTTELMPPERLTPIT